MEPSDKLHTLASLSQGKNPGTHYIGGWLGPRNSLGDVVEKYLTLAWIRTWSRPVV
jgi:hypothetical protein